MKETDCRKCCVSDFKDALCEEEFCEKYYREGSAEDFEKLLRLPERKKGKWIKVNGKTAINCSACYHCSWSLPFEDTVKRFNFCPNCGARMEETE